MRASWNGYMRVGDVTLPVRLYSGTRSASPHFVQLHAKDHAPVTRIALCQMDGEELRPEDIIRAAEVDGKYIEMTDKDIQASGVMERNITVSQFSEIDAIDSIYYDKPYYIVPGKGGEIAYTILRQAFLKAKKVAVATYMMYEKEHLGIIRALDGILLLQQLRFAEEIVPRRDINTPPLPQPSPSQVDVAVKLMERYSTSFYIDDYKNEQLDTINEIIERRAKGLQPKRRPQIASRTTPVDEVIPRLKALLTDNQTELREAASV